MRKSTPRMRDFAKRLIAHEMATGKSPRTTIPAAFIVCEKLRPPLATLLGNAGFVALLSRALALTNREAGSLSELRVAANGSLTGLAGPEAGVELLAQLLGLLVTFIGHDLTIRLVREVWPKMPSDDPDPGKGSKK